MTGDGLSKVTVLVVEDDAVDAMAVERSFRKLKIVNPIVVARDGLDAFELLRGKDGGAGIEKPFIILLDLNMPRMNGIEFLTALRADPQLKSSVVFVLTTSRLDEDRAHAYNLNVAGYIMKSEAGRGFLDAIVMIDHYWRVVELPR